MTIQSRGFQPKRFQKGQGMTEYIIITALIAVAAIGAFTLFGKTVRTQVAGMAAEMGGNSAKSSTAVQAAAAAGGAAVDNNNKDVTLGNYNTTATAGGAAAEGGSD